MEIDSKLEWQGGRRIRSSSRIERLRVKHLTLLEAIGALGNLHQAAAVIHVTQPSATKLLADVEEAFGFPLFERLPRGMRPTPLGQEVVAYATQTRAGLQRFLEDLELKRQGGFGQLVVGAIMGAAPDLIAHAVTELKAERPRLNVRILGETSDQVAALLERREIELAVGRFASLQQHNEFDFEPLANESLRLVVRAEHALAGQGDVALADLLAWPWIMQPVSSPARQVLESEFGDARLPSPGNVVECGSIFATLQLLQTSEAVAMLPESVVRDYLKAGLLRELPLAVGQKLTGFGVLTRREDVLSEPAQAFCALQRKYATHGAHA
ncbi:MAG: LysR family transcriptional regulator [Ralstonia sp.]